MISVYYVCYLIFDACIFLLCLVIDVCVRFRDSGFGSRVPPGFRVWLQGSSRVWVQGLVWRVWAPRFGVSGLSLEGLGSKVWGFRVSFGGFGLQRMSVWIKGLCNTVSESCYVFHQAFLSI